ncbi:MAG: alpha-galactosidase [Candidatus Sumerlaeota bacterium]
MLIDQMLLETILEKGRPPFNFHIGDSAIVAEMLFHEMEEQDDGSLHRFVYGAADGALSIVLEIHQNPGLNMLTWSTRLVADKDIDAPIRKVALMDLNIATGDGSPMLRGWNGAANWLDDGTYPHHNFQIRDTEMTEGSVVELETNEGRAACDYLPMWVLSDGEQGAWFGPEWSGTWRFMASAQEQSIQLRFELQYLDFAMKQGEEIQLPPFTLGGFKGDAWEGCLQMRRCIAEAFTPRVDGEIEDPRVIYQVLGGPASKLDADGISKEIDVLSDIGAESFVWATSYYRPCRNSSIFPDFRDVHPNMGKEGEPDTWGNWWEKCGDFKPHPERFPEGGPAHAKMLEERGMRWGWWIDPRIAVYSDTFKTSRPDALLPFKAKEPERRHEMWNLALIDTSREAGRKYLYDMLKGFIETYGSRWIWHDLNVELRERYWWHSEEPDRRGLRELRYHEGMNEVFDRIIREYPGVRVEWCASGGTMINLGILRRCHLMWVTDHTKLDVDDAGDAYTDTLRTFRSFLHWILPASYIMNALTVGRSAEKNRRSTPEFLIPHMGSNLTFDQYILDWDESDQVNVKKAVEVFKSIRHLLNKEYYGLFKPPRALDEWDGWQFHDPETGEGVLFLFRGHDCEEESASIEPRWITPGETQFETLLGEATGFDAEGGAIQVTMPGKAGLVRYGK